MQKVLFAFAKSLKISASSEVLRKFTNFPLNRLPYDQRLAAYFETHQLRKDIGALFVPLCPVPQCFASKLDTVDPDGRLLRRGPDGLAGNLNELRKHVSQAHSLVLWYGISATRLS